MRMPCSCMQGKQAVEEAHRLQSEKVALIDMVKRLNRDVARLEAFKKNLLQHLHEDEEVRSGRRMGRAGGSATR